MFEQKSKFPLGKIVTEMFGIVFAVLIALWLDQWVEDRDQHELAKELDQRIQYELNDNREDLVEAIATNTALIDGVSGLLASYRASPESDLDIGVLASGFSSASPSDAAWRSAQMTRTLSIMPMERVEALAGLYATQDQLERYSNHIIERFGIITAQLANQENTEAVLLEFLYSLSIFNQISDQLLDSYNGFLGSQEAQAGGQENGAPTQ